MNMGGSSSAATKKATCKISMLWNWYTIDTCFIARSWRNDTKGKFAGSCIGCFALVVVAQWLTRFSRQFDVELLRRQKIKHLANYSPEEYVVKCGDEDAKSDMEELQGFHNEASWKTTLIALQKSFIYSFYVWGPRGLNNPEDDLLKKILSCCSLVTPVELYPSFLDHMVRVTIFVLQWGLSYIIMLLFMYYNGYIIISCLIGAIVGRFIFCYEPLGSMGGGESAQSTVSYDKESDDRKCCL
ncbi:hypothetical protein SEUBUCD646_0L04490 [Saccharomyces eubayanus]|uniref:Copper transport protein n=1 Tax=Saccharomyces eubayanus TaxID=1080349 RepID=A0ABN8VKA2_SACEU|nr:hypothetical protein SEUBUCD650_0L04490 [Saccharomyces eubayanus]CAI1632585.1 hypothetical protein SEUBUCD646_0L04490 [Saccharomyces eubayanus]